MSDISGFLEKVFDGFKRITPALIAVVIGSGAVLFLPQSILTKLNLLTISDSWRSILGIAFLLSSVLVIVIVATIIFKAIRNSIKSKLEIRALKRSINKLSAQQKRIIRTLLESEDKTVLLNSISGDTVYLQQKGFIFQPRQFVSDYGHHGMQLKYAPQLWLLDLYNRNPNLFK